MGVRPVALVGALTSIFTGSAAHRERKGSQPDLCYLASTLHASSIAAFIDPQKRGVDLIQRRRLDLNHRTFDVVLDTALRGLSGVEYIALTGHIATYITNPVVHVMTEFATPLFEPGSQLTTQRLRRWRLCFASHDVAIHP